MIHASIFIALAACSSNAAPVISGVDAKWTAPKLYVEGQAYNVHIDLSAPDGSVPAWMLTSSAFTIDGKPLSERKHTEEVKVEGGKKTVDLDLGPVFVGSKLVPKHGFKLDYGEGGNAIDVRFGVPAEKGLSFMDEKKIATADLANYHVVLHTVRGDMEVEFWPDVAPGHVRNFLDLSYTGFYDATAFHRVLPGFMIQGGDPNTKDMSKRQMWGTGNGPRMLKHEFNAKKHVRGVLSMARNGDPRNDAAFYDTASCQFFIMDGANVGLDNKYSGFGMLVDGFDTLDKIVKSPGTAGPDGTIAPTEPQRIQKATVVRIVKDEKK